jgi:outer membrane protein assembly factor BamD (BamD/ComL family)
MKKRVFVISILAGVIFLAATVTFAQGGATQGPDVVRDPEMEKDSLHNLEAARFYFGKLRKAYVASLQRCEEILAGNPTFAKIDEVLYMAGKSSMNLSEGKGKQAATQYVIREGEKKTTLSSEEFRQKARDYLSQLVAQYPQSAFKSQAEDDLKTLGGAKPNDTKP